MSKLTKAQYTLQIFANKMENAKVKAYLEDKYLKTMQVLSLSDTNWIKFDIVSSAPASSSASRFNIVFKDMAGLSGTVSALAAVKKDRQAQIDWTVSNETGISKYVIQRSANGTSFTTISEVTAKGSNSSQVYQVMDAAPVSGNNYYRIRSVPVSGSHILSNVAMVNMGDMESSISIFPNPIENNQINIRFKTIEEGRYTFVVFDLQGRPLERQTIEHKTGMNYHNAVLKNKLPIGMYYLRVENSKTNYVTSFQVKE